jgi:hypothetical protein
MSVPARGAPVAKGTAPDFLVRANLPPERSYRQAPPAPTDAVRICE